MLATVGDATFRDTTIPVPGKSEFGMDALTRKMEGWVGENGEFLIAFIQGLNQGDTYAFGDVLFYLQTWSADDGTPLATVTLNYKGLKPGGTPEPDIQTDITSAKGNISRDFSTENAGHGRISGITELWLSDSVNPPTEGSYIDVIVGTRTTYAKSAVMEFTYRAVQSRYRYILTGRPQNARYEAVESDFIPRIEDAVITLSDGTKLGKASASTFDLNPEVIERLVSFISHNVIGSPYFECEDVVQKILADPLSP